MKPPGGGPGEETSLAGTDHHQSDQPTRAQPHNQSNRSSTRRRQLTEVHATAYAPSPGRNLWNYAVMCPGGHVHLHRAGPPRPAGYVRRAPCGVEYVLLARTVLPSSASVVAGAVV